MQSASAIRRSAGSIGLVLVILLGGSAVGENIDPADRMAWSENAGWINLQPLGPGGPGVQVDDFELSGWMWSENLGWISLSCRNTDACDRSPYGVTQDGRGVLRGQAWSENAGWLNFSCATTGSCASVDYGVSIDPATGVFSGHAWGENVGWVTFAAVTTWTCEPPPPPPVGPVRVEVAAMPEAPLLQWPTVEGATAFDVIRGDLSALRAVGGRFGMTEITCLADNLTGTAWGAPELPAAGDGYWFLVRAVHCGASGSYDSGEASQPIPRDDAVAASGGDCP